MSERLGRITLSFAVAFVTAALVGVIVVGPLSDSGAVTRQMRSQTQGFCSTTRTSIEKATLKLDAAGKYANGNFNKFKAAVVDGYENVLSVAQANTKALPRSTTRAVRQADARELAVLRRVIQRLESATNTAQMNVEDITNRTNDVDTIRNFLEAKCGISSVGLG